MNVGIGQRRCHDDKQTEDVQQIRFSAWIAGFEGGNDECENALQRALALLPTMCDVRGEEQRMFKT